MEKEPEAVLRALSSEKETTKESCWCTTLSRRAGASQSPAASVKLARERSRRRWYFRVISAEAAKRLLHMAFIELG